MEKHGQINIGTVGVVLSFIHDVLNSGKLVWLPLQYLVKFSKVNDESDSLVLFRNNERRRFPF